MGWSKKSRKLLRTVKAAVALHSFRHRVEDLRAEMTLREAGVEAAQKEMFFHDLARLMRSETTNPTPESLEKRIRFAGDTTLSQIAGAAAETAEDENPDSCLVWSKESFFPKVKAAVSDWALDPPGGGINSTTKLGPLREPFNPASCSLLMNALRAKDIFQPYSVQFRGVCTDLSGDSTVEELAKALWDGNIHPCKQHVDFP